MKKIKRIIKTTILHTLSGWKNEIDRLNHAKTITNTLLKLKSTDLNCKLELPYLIEGEKYISIGKGFRARNNLRIEAIDNYGKQKFNPEISIGNNVTIESNCHIGCIDKISIGDGTLIASNVFITDHSHGEINHSDLNITPIERKLTSKGPVRIGKNVWIGEGVTILAGVEIEDGAIIGAKSLVINSVGEKSIAVGIPATVIRKL